MALQTVCSCGGCKVLDKACDACKRCKPKYICAEVNVTPGPYSEYSCCGSFGFRLDYDCGVYVGSGSCPDGVSLDLNLELIESESVCQTIVHSSLLSEPLVFDCILPEMSFSVDNAHGDILDVVVGHIASVIENPIAKLPCSPCKEAPCLPCRLCLVVWVRDRYSGTEIVRGKKVSVIGEWNGNGWTVPSTEITFADFPDESVAFSLAIDMLPPETGACGVHIMGSLTMGSDQYGTGYLDQEIYLDGEMIDWTLQFIQFGGQTAGTVHIKDASCGGCAACNSTFVMGCCDYAEWPPTITASDGTHSVTLYGSPGGTLGSVIYAGTRNPPTSFGGCVANPGSAIYVAFECILHGDKLLVWYGTDPFCGVYTRVMEGTCDPIDLSNGDFTVTA